MTAANDRLPTPLSERLASASSAIYSRQGREVDVAIGGVPFRLATNSQIPQTVETIQVRKEQFDAENDPGEQSLTSWWRRSQSSWHEGAGSLYQERTDRDVFSGALTAPNFTFYDSRGVDVFSNRGQMTLLRNMLNKGQVAGTVLSRIRTYALAGQRTNQVTNPSFETDISGWTATGNIPPTLAQSSAQASIGTKSLLATWGADLGNINAPIPYVGVAGQKFSCSVRVYVPTGSPSVEIVGAFVTGTNSGSLKDQWVTLTLQSSIISTAAQLQIRPQTPPSAGNTVYVDAAICEVSTQIIGSYFDGGYGGPGTTAWTGTANLSTSTLTVANQLPNLSAVCSGAFHTASGDPASGAFSSMHAPGGKTIVDGLISGTTFYDVASDGTLYAGDVSTPGSATTWPCGATPSRLAWGKHRLWMIGGRKLWQPDVTLSNGTAQNPIFTHPNLGWTYTCIAEGPAAMYFGGHSGNSSSIQAVALDTSGGVPSLSGAQNTTILPDGELVQEIAVLAGQYLGIGTNKGFRIGVFGGTNSIQVSYGPLIIEPTGVTACTALTTQGRFFLVSFSTNGGTTLAYKVDTSEEVTNGTFAYAADIDCGFVGSITSLAAGAWDSGGGNTSVVYATTSDGRAWGQSTSQYVSSGYLQTGRIRYKTTEPKLFKFFTCEIEPLAGNIQVSMVTDNGTLLPLGNITNTGNVFTDQFAISYQPQRFASIKFVLTPDTSGATTAPVIHSYQVRAVPAVTPQRMITLPLMCYDREESRSGQWYGGIGYANDRLTAMQILESGDSVVYQDFSTLNSTGQIVTIESLKYVQEVPPPANKSGNNGGILIVQLRTVGT